MKQLSPSFFARDTVTVARDLIGKIIFINGLKVRITETEAYGRDEASHAFKRTERSSLMFNTYGYVYVYLIYGMYYCLNFTAHDNDAGAVLIRAVEPLFGKPLSGGTLSGFKSKLSKVKFNVDSGLGNDSLTKLCSGPGKLCKFLNIDKSFNGLKLGKEIKVYNDEYQTQIAVSSRIGISKAKELPWRFLEIKKNKIS